MTNVIGCLKRVGENEVERTWRAVIVKAKFLLGSKRRTQRVNRRLVDYIRNTVKKVFLNA